MMPDVVIFGMFLFILVVVIPMLLSVRGAQVRAISAQRDAIDAQSDLIRRQALRIATLEGRFDIIAHLKRMQDFSGRTFGPNDGTPERLAGVRDHIRKELLELERTPYDVEEWIDVIMLASDGAWRAGATAEQIIDAWEAKQTKNESRVWPDWRTAEPGKAIEHDRSHD